MRKHLWPTLLLVALAVTLFIALMGILILKDPTGAMDCLLEKEAQSQEPAKEEPITITSEEPTVNTTTSVSFTDTLKRSGSDKYSMHHYERYYGRWFEPLRNEAITMLEIGARDGKSLQVWYEYFTKARLILGLAYDHGGNTRGVEEKFADMANVVVVRGDQSKSETMKDLASRGPYDILIDDGSHVPEHMMFGLFSLWKTVKPGGLYVIEDLETNYWRTGAELYGYYMNGTGIGSGPDRSAVSKLKQLVDVLARYQIGAPTLSVMPGDETICSIEFGMNLVLLRKCTLEEGATQPQNKKYEKRVNVSEVLEWGVEARKTNPTGVAN